MSYFVVMADQFSGLDMCVNHTCKIVHMCDLQHACCFAHEKDKLVMLFCMSMTPKLQLSARLQVDRS